MNLRNVYQYAMARAEDDIEIEHRFLKSMTEDVDTLMMIRHLTKENPYRIDGLHEMSIINAKEATIKAIKKKIDFLENVIKDSFNMLQDIKEDS